MIQWIRIVSWLPRRFYWGWFWVAIRQLTLNPSNSRWGQTCQATRITHWQNFWYCINSCGNKWFILPFAYSRISLFINRYITIQSKIIKCQIFWGTGFCTVLWKFLKIKIVAMSTKVKTAIRHTAQKRSNPTSPPLCFSPVILL